MPRRRTGSLMRIVVIMLAGLLLLAGCAPAGNAPSAEYIVSHFRGLIRPWWERLPDTGRHVGE